MKKRNMRRIMIKNILTMNQRNIFLLIILILAFFDCYAQNKVVTKSDNHIELKATRQPALVNRSDGFVMMSTKDGRFWDNVHPKISGIPDSLQDIKVYYYFMDGVQALYHAYKAGLVKKGDYDYYIKAWGSDTTICTPKYVKTYVVIATGKSITGEKILFN